MNSFLLMGALGAAMASLGLPASASVSVQPEGTRPLIREGDFSSEMAAGIGRFLDRELAASVAGRTGFWRPDFSGREKYETSVAPNRERLARILGVVDSRVAGADLELVATTSVSAKVAETDAFVVFAVRWPVFRDVHGEGLLLRPKGPILARVVAIPDADQPPEVLAGLAPGLPPEAQYARRLAESGCEVIIPTLIDRSDRFSGSVRMERFTNQPHREWIYRQAFTFGRHVIGYEVQKILAAVDWFARQSLETPAPIGVAGWGEGALLAFYSAALDGRIDAALVSGYFGRRERLWEEPIYRNVFGLLREFGDAELARLIVPRSLLIEPAAAPQIDGPPPPRPGPVRLGASAAPGRITTAARQDVHAEVERAWELAGPFRGSIQWIMPERHVPHALGETTALAFLQKLQPGVAALGPGGEAPAEMRSGFDPSERQYRQVTELERHIQAWIEQSRHRRDEFFWKANPPAPPEQWTAAAQSYRDHLWDEVIGRIPESTVPLDARARRIFDRPSWTGYEVLIDVAEDIFAWGYLLLPKDLKPGEKRPVIVAQHGGSGVPDVVLDEDRRAYKGYALRLVERGFVVFAPHFPWRAGDDYRVLQRKANPLGLSVFSVILAQHERVLDWLTGQSFVDPDRIGLYGLSWGGKVAVRVPALLDRYALSVCSGDFNEWIWKNATTDWPNSYMFVPEYEMFDFNLGMTYGYAEMAALIAPRAFMVERGHNDGVGIDEWVAFEYAKVNRLYNKMGIAEMTRIAYFDGGHEINAVEAFEFIHERFSWPEPGSQE